MALQRVSGSDYAIRPQEELRPRVGTSSPGQSRPAGGTQLDLPVPGSRRPGAGDVPNGADPHVWLGLSVEERAHFARLDEEGPLSYGPTRGDGDVLLYRGRHLHIKA